MLPDIFKEMEKMGGVMRKLKVAGVNKVRLGVSM